MNSAERYERSIALFHQVCDLPEEKRVAFLADACGDDTNLRRAVDLLLQHDSNADTAVVAGDQGEGIRALSAIAIGDDETMPKSIGQYRIVRKIGQGGMGIVYEAQQDHPRRTVALKVLHSGLVTAGLQKRFRREADFLGRLQHPGIAQIYEAGVGEVETESGARGQQPFFAMELITGQPLDQFVRAQGLNDRARLELFSKICDGVQHAHDRGVIHRDLKPGNILVTVGGQPKILDFGVSRATDADLHTVTMRTDTGQLVGTIPYMSPEQVYGDALGLDERSDVYSLGVVLFELLAERLPQDVRNRPIPEAVRIIREEDPTSLGSLDRRFRGDVETIVAKSLEKAKDRRYQSVAELAADIRRYLADEPLIARPASSMYQLRKFARRRKALVGGLVATFLALTLGLMGTGYGLIVATEQRDRAEASRMAEAAANDRLQVIVDFQSSMLTDINVEEMGGAMISAIRADIDASLLRRESTPAEREAVTAALELILKEINPSNLARNALDVSVLLKAAETIDQRFADQPLVEADLRGAIANTYSKLGLFVQSAPHMKRTLDLRQRELGEDHADTLTALSDLGRLYMAMGEYSDAEPCLQETLERRTVVLGPDHPDTLMSLDNVGLLFKRRGKYPEARTYFDRALERRSRVLGDEHEDTLLSIAYIGGILLKQGKYVEAESYYRRALEGRKRVLGVDHTGTLTLLHNMGHLLSKMARFDEAEPYYREVLEIRRRVLGDDHPSTLSSISNLGSLLQRAGKLDEAMPFVREAMQSRRRVLGDTHPSTLTSINNMGTLLFFMKQLAEAEPYMRQTLDGQRRRLGKDHPHTIQASNNLMALLSKLQRMEEAEALARQVLASSRRVNGNEHPETFIALNNLGGHLVARRKPDQAEPFLREALVGCRRILTDNHRVKQESISNLADALQDLGQSSESELLSRELLAIRRERLSATHEKIGRSLLQLGASLNAQRKFAEAESALRECLVIQEENFPDDHWRIPATRILLGETLVGLGRYDEAETLLLGSFKALQERKESIPAAARHASLEEARDRLVSLYESWNKPQEAAKWQAHSTLRSSQGSHDTFNGRHP